MNDSWNDMRKAKEEMYFQKQNEDALKKIKLERSGSTRKSPINGEPMEEIVFKGVVVDRCIKTGGIWLDPGELEKIIQESKNEVTSKDPSNSVLSDLLSFISKK